MLRIILLLLLPVILTAGAGRTQRFLIEWGWHTPRLQQFPDYLEGAQNTPFHGAVIDIETPLDGRGLSWTLFGNEPVDVDTLESLAAKYADLEWGRFTENFLRFTVHPADVDWFDDWQIIFDNAEAWAKLAHELGFVGVLLDVEQYSKANLFEYPAQIHADRRSFDDYAAQAFQHGREFMDALERGHPNLTVMYTFALTVDPALMESRMESHHYGLLIPFVEGMIEAADSTTLLIDGYENSYGYQGMLQFARARRLIKSAELRYADAESTPNRMLASFGLWIDPVCGDGGLPPEGCGASPEAFQKSVRSAMQLSDRYVWIYSQKIDWYTGYGIPPVWWNVMRSVR